MDDTAPDYVDTQGGARLAYQLTQGNGPTVVFLSGFASHMGGTKALHLERWAAGAQHAYLRLDYQGHGKSSGRFEDGSIGIWAQDAMDVIEHVTRGPLVLVGSSMGAWIMLLAARRLGERVRGLVGIASAPDFTEELIHAQLTAQQKAELNKAGRLERASTYDQGPNVVTLRMLEDGREHLQLGDMIPLECPVRLIHGMRDADVPWEISLRLCDRLEAEDVQVILLKDGDHRLSKSANLKLLVSVLEDLLVAVGEDG